VVAYLDQHASETAVVVVDPAWDRIPYEYYSPRRGVADPPPEELARASDIWLIAERYGGAPPTSPTEAWLDARARLVETVKFSRLEARRYRGGE
jgi:hypothetical protein